jgi:hypothetical protein
MNQRYDDEPRQPTFSEYVWTVITAVCAALVVVIVVLLATSCTPAQQQTLSNTTQATLTGVKIAACVQGVLAEQEQARALASRLAETAAELEAERIRSAVSEPSDSVKDEVEKVLK